MSRKSKNKKVIYSVKRFFKDLRAGSIVEGFVVYFITQDNNDLCYSCAYKNCLKIGRAMRNQNNKAWRVITNDYIFASKAYYCCNCGNPIH